MNAAVVTGAAGFIGSHLSRALLLDGWTVLGIDNFDPFYSRADKERNLNWLRDSDFTLLEADIRDRPAMERAFAAQRPQVVYHLAALAGVRPSISQPDRFIDVNLNGTASILDAARSAGCRTVIFASSSSVYGNNEKAPFAETDPVDEPISPYAATKRAGELLCHAYARLYDLRIASLRFFTAYGPGQRPDLAIMKFMRLIGAGEPVPMFGDGATSRDYTYIDDIIRGVLAARERIERDDVESCRIWNLGHSSPIRLREMIDSIARIVGKSARIEMLPMQPGDVERTWADLSRSQNELNYRPTTCFDDGLRKQWDWLRATM